MLLFMTNINRHVTCKSMCIATDSSVGYMRSSIAVIAWSLSLHLAQLLIAPCPNTHYVPNRPRHLRKCERLLYRISNRYSDLPAYP